MADYLTNISTLNSKLEKVGVNLKTIAPIAKSFGFDLSKALSDPNVNIDKLAKGLEKLAREMGEVEEQSDVVNNPQKYGYGDPDRWIRLRR